LLHDRPPRLKIDIAPIRADHFNLFTLPHRLYPAISTLRVATI
jgi:hypothetical protein